MLDWMDGDAFKWSIKPMVSKKSTFNATAGEEGLNYHIVVSWDGKWWMVHTNRELTEDQAMGLIKFQEVDLKGAWGAKEIGKSP